MTVPPVSPLTDAPGPRSGVPETLAAAASATPAPADVLRRLEALAEAGADLSPPDLARTLIPVLLNSRALANRLRRHPEWLASLADATALARPTTRRALSAQLEAALAHPTDLDEATRVLRQVRNQAYLRITARDVALDVPADETCAELTDLAEVLLEFALRTARAAVRQKRGEPLDAAGRPIEFVVIGMGKLGGRELNYSSDIDLIHLYGTDDAFPEGQASPDDTPVDRQPHEHFRRVCETISRLLSETTEDGFCFRVDLGLRPEGRSGPLCNSLASAERYYETWGRTWERLAWLRARVVAGDPALGVWVMRTLEPWIHRRTIDPHTLDEISALKAQILRQRLHLQARGHAAGLDLKLDRGGIRAIEFFVNTLQLVHAGRQPILRDASTLGALRRLFAVGHLNDADLDRLTAAYLLLRRVEHRVQMEDDRQTHRLPAGDALDALARRLGHTSAEPGRALVAQIDHHRDQVAEMFDALLGQTTSPVEGEHLARARGLISAHSAPEERRAALRACGVADPEQAVHLLDSLTKGPASPFSPRASAQLNELGVFLLSEALQSPEPDRALSHLAAFIGHSARRSIYLRGLTERRAAARLLVGVFAASEFLSEQLVRQPGLIESIYSRSPRADAREVDLAAAQAVEGARDGEQFHDRLGRFKQREEVLIGLADLAGELDHEGVEQALSALAETVLRQVCDRVWAECVERFGAPRRADDSLAQWCVVGVGKLGGSELTYGSDLDLLFLFDERLTADAPTALAERTSGPRSVGHLEFFTRFAQRVLSLLSLPTAAGTLYRVDTRLRPGGDQGTLVSRLASFVAYHERRADPWERIALVRARCVAGPATMRALATRHLTELAYLRPPPGALRPQLRHLRQRMEVEVAREAPGRYNPKLGRGGLVDIEFITQVLQVERGGASPELRTPRSRDALLALARAGELPEMAALLNAWRFLRRLEHRVRIVRAQAMPELRAEARSIESLARRLGYHTVGRVAKGSPGEHLLAEYRRTTEEVRQIFDAVFNGAGGDDGD